MLVQAAEAALAPRSSLHVEPRLTHARLEATVPRRGREVIAAEELPVAGYLMARALDRRKVDGEDLERLRRADESLRETRALLPFGRGNVMEDNQATAAGAFSRLAAARALDPARGPATPAQTIWAGAGACSEHAQLATIVHAARLDPALNDAVVTMSSVPGGHAWAESVIPRPWTLASLWKPDDRTIVIDAWKDGPAVFAPDSTRHPAQWLTATATLKVAQPRPELLADAKVAARRIAMERDSADIPLRRPPQALLFEARTIVSPAFLSQALGKTDPVVPGPGTLPEHHTVDHPRPRHSVMPVELRKEILAAGVARDLMAPRESPERTPPGRGRVHSAATQAPAIMNAVGELMKITARRPAWEPPFEAYRTGRFYAVSAPRVVTRTTDATLRFPAEEA